MKSLTLVGAKGTLEVLTSTTLTELATWLGSYAEALVAFNILLKMEHHCDACSSTEGVEYSHLDKEHLCSECMEDY